MIVGDDETKNRHGEVSGTQFLLGGNSVLVDLRMRRRRRAHRQGIGEKVKGVENEEKGVLVVKGASESDLCGVRVGEGGRVGCEREKETRVLLRLLRRHLLLLRLQACLLLPPSSPPQSLAQLPQPSSPPPQSPPPPSLPLQASLLQVRACRCEDSVARSHFARPRPGWPAARPHPPPASDSPRKGRTRASPRRPKEERNHACAGKGSP